MITGTMNVPMTLEKANYYNTLEARDKAMPIVANEYEYNGEKKKYYKCPACGEYWHEGENFCSTCGQRIDTQNIEI